MKKIKAISLIIFLLFSSCVKKTGTQQNNNDSTNKNITEQTFKCDIENISYFIFHDLKLEWNYNNLEDLLKTLDISDDYQINKRTVKNTIITGGTGYFVIYDIESKKYKITVSTFKEEEEEEGEEVNDYKIEVVELEINEDNYLKLFPYKNKKDYMEDKDFGKIMDINTEKDNVYYIMRYGVDENDDRLGYCDLLFTNDLLKSIRIIRYTP